MPTQHRFYPSQYSPQRELERDGGVTSRVLKASILIAVLTTIGIASLTLQNPLATFTVVTASLVDNLGIKPKPAGDQFGPTIQSTIATDALPPDAPQAPEQIAASKPDPMPTETGQPQSEVLLRQFQAWAAENDAPLDVMPAAVVQDVPEVLRGPPARLADQSRHIRRIRTARVDAATRNPPLLRRAPPKDKPSPTASR
jgi:hypothetical protein